MKLADLLARELESWPEGVSHLVSSFAGELFGTKNGPPVFDEGYNRLPWTILGIGCKASVTWVLHGGTHLTVAPKDYDTAIITRSQWQSARDKLKGESAMQKPKGNKDGWIRHRGGLCPVKCDTKVDVRYRDGSIHNGVVYGQSPECIDWRHDGVDSDIMAYRLHAPEQASKVEYTEIKPERLEQIVSRVHRGAKPEPLILDYDPAQSYYNLAQPSGPLQWRDLIREIDAEQQAADETYKEATEHRSAQRAELVAKLKAEGLALISEPIKAEDSAQGDMGDWRNWLPGDKVELLSTLGDTANEGDLLVVSKVEGITPNQPVRLSPENDSKDGWWPNPAEMKWHSRPSKP